MRSVASREGAARSFLVRTVCSLVVSLCFSSRSFGFIPKQAEKRCYVTFYMSTTNTCVCNLR